MSDTADIFELDAGSVVETAKAWRPRPLTHAEWPPDYRGVYIWRAKQLAALRASAAALASAKVYYAKRPAEFIMDWMDTYDPRRTDGPKWVPFVFFNRQALYLQFLEECKRDQASGLVEKCRDAGVTWLSVGYTAHQWLFENDNAIGWGSRKQMLVDRAGDIDSIFEKIRKTLDRLPAIWKPKDYELKQENIVNRDNGSSITGESGDDIGRGGRKGLYFKDESAHYAHPERIEASLGDNTNVQIDISSVNGLGNVFHRRRKAGQDWAPGAQMVPGVTRVFVFDWRDHPAKDKAWYDGRRAKYESEGLLHVFKQEVDRDYAGSLQGTIIPAEWIAAAVDAHVKLKEWGDWYAGEEMAGFDIADEGGDTNAFVRRKGVVLNGVQEWGDRDPGKSARRAISIGLETPGLIVNYDSIGIGTNVKSEINRLTLSEDGVTPAILKSGAINFVSWSAGAGVLWQYARVIEDDPSSPLNGDFFGNLKAQAWWGIRGRFYRTFKAITEGVKYDVATMISLDSSVPLLSKLMSELAQPTVSKSAALLKMIVDKKPDNTKSPNLADGAVMCYFPVEDFSGNNLFGSYGTQS